MERGDIGDDGWRSMRIVLVWEGVCASPPVGNEGLLRRFRRQQDYDKVVRSWVVHEPPLQRIYALNVRGVPVDIVTFLGEDYCNALVERLDRMHVEVARVDWYEDPMSFARELRVSPDVQYVVDSDQERLNLYGKRGLYTPLGGDWGQFI